MIGISDNHEGAWPKVGDRVCFCTKFADSVIHHQCQTTQHVVGGNKAICITELVQTEDSNIQQFPTRVALHEFTQALVQKLRFGQIGNRVDQCLLGGTTKGITHAEAQFLNVERLGDIIDHAQLQPVQFVDPVALFGQENDGYSLGAAICTQPAANLVAVNVR